MFENLSFGNYRAILGAGDEKAFAIVTAHEVGTVSWDLVTEQEFNDSQHDDLPEALFAQVNDVYIQLNSLNDDITDEAT